MVSERSIFSRRSPFEAGAGIFAPRQPARTLLYLFAAFILVGTVLLALPISARSGQSVGFSTALFTATSAVCVTGLSVVDIVSTFSPIGQAVLITLVQLGGLGYMLSSTFLFLLLGREMGLGDRLLLRDTLGGVALRDTRRIVYRAIGFTLGCEALGALILAGHFWWDEGYPFPRAVGHGIFHAISAFCNAGFDLNGVGPNGETSLGLFRNDPWVVLPLASLIVLGGVGFATCSEIWDTRAWKGGWKRLSLVSRLVLTMTGLLISLGFVAFAVAEWTNPNTLGPLSPGAKLLDSFFQSVSWRTAGFATVDVGETRSITLLVGGLFMFIGGAPGSTAGGIKVTTAAVVLAAVIAALRARPDVEMFGRRIASTDVFRALVLVMLAFGAIVVGTFVLAFTEPENMLKAGFRDNLFMQIQFEVISATNTVGLSTGITSSLTESGRILVIALMFLGRLGPTTIAAALIVAGRKPKRRLPETNLALG